MRYNDLTYSVFYEDTPDIKSQVLDILSIMAGEGVDSVNMSVLIKSLTSVGISVDNHALFDILDNLAIVRNIKDDVVFFNTDSEASQGLDKEPDGEKQDRQIDKLARKQVKKGLDK